MSTAKRHNCAVCGACAPLKSFCCRGLDAYAGQGHRSKIRSQKENVPFSGESKSGVGKKAVPFRRLKRADVNAETLNKQQNGQFDLE